MHGSISSSGINGSWDGREPVFRDVPFEQSEWAMLYEALRRVSLPKAELVRVQYETVRMAYQNYISAREQELSRYAQQRAQDEEYNKTTLEQRDHWLKAIETIRQRWQPELERLRQAMTEAQVEAHEQAARAGLRLRSNAEGYLEFEPTNSTPAPRAGSLTPEPSPQSTPPPRRHALSLLFTAPETPEQPTKPLEPLTRAEAAQALRLPRDQTPVLPWWLYRGAPVMLGLALGQILLTALGEPLGAWYTLPFWIASLAGIMLGLIWFRAVWSLSRAVSELYYLFDWDATKAKRAAWLGGGILMVTILVPIALILVAIGLLPAAWAKDAQLLALATILVSVPLIAAALVGGYLRGRQVVIQDAIESGVLKAQREQHAACENIPSAPQAAPCPEPTDTYPNGESNGTTALHPDSTGGRTAAAPTGVSRAPMEPPPDTTESLLPAVQAAIARANALVQAYHLARATMQEELLSHEHTLHELQLRPIYPYLPPDAERRLATLYRQWAHAYAAFLDYVSEALREVKGGPQLQQHIQAFKETLLR